MAIKVRIMLLGDGGVGKTSMCHRLVGKEFPSVYVPTIFEADEHEMVFQGRDYSITLLDTAGQEDYEVLRKNVAWGLKPDVVILCYSLDRPESFNNSRNAWYREIKERAPSKPIVLVAAKKDLRRNRDTSRMKTYLEGMDLKSELKAFAFYECSAKTNEFIREIFEGCIYAFEQTKKQSPEGSCCSLM